MDGICTLANDRVYDQLIALLNSIEVILGPDMPVCVYPYDDNTTKIAAEIAKRPNVQLYDDRDSIQRWDRFVRDVWDTHPTARERWQKVGEKSYYRVGTHRRFCAFDGPFDRFIYMDADTLVMGPMKPIFELLDRNDWVVYDFQYKDPTHVYEISSSKLNEVFSPERVTKEIFCSGFYASKKNTFTQKNREWLLSNLKEGEVEILYPMAPDQTVINYMVMRSGIPIYNLAFNLPADRRTGCTVASTHFQEKDRILYDNGKRLTYIHYIGVKSKFFKQLCDGKNIDFPYRNVFLYYRYLHEMEKWPKLGNKPKSYDRFPSLAARILRRFGIKL